MNPERFRGFLKLALKTGVLLWVCIFFTVLVLGLALTGLQVRSIASTHAEAEGLKAQTDEAEAAQKSMGDMDAFLKEQREDFEKTKGLLLKAGEQPKVISFLTRTMQTLGVSIQDIRPAGIKTAEADRPAAAAPPPEEGPKKLAPVLFELQLESRYEALGLFFEKLENAPVYLTVEDFVFEPKEASPAFLSARMTLAAYERKEA